MSNTIVKIDRQIKVAEQVNRIGQIIRDIKVPDILVAGFDMSIEPNPLPREV